MSRKRRAKPISLEQAMEQLREFNRIDLLNCSFETPESLSRKLPAVGKRCPDMDGQVPWSDDGRYAEEFDCSR